MFNTLVSIDPAQAHFANAEIPSRHLVHTSHVAAAMFFPETPLADRETFCLSKKRKNGPSRHLQRLRQGSGADMPLLHQSHLVLPFLP